ncbi:transposase [Leptolyngbya sp. DQ-M1]|uniref:transposase n=1 Tax=Leptolyngbya sp. DQ-M1 TaxID=2933920 RepID=UPI003298F130
MLAGQATATPKSSEGAVEMIRILKAARDTAVKAQTQVMVALKAMIVTADAALRAQLEPLSTPQLIKACQQLEVGTLDTPIAAMRYALAAMAKRWAQLHEEIETHTQHLTTLTQAAAPELVQAFGIGTDTAAEMLITFGENAERVHSEAAFAKMCGVCLIPASSGKTQRHRLNRAGNRQANAALFRVVIVRMRCTSRPRTTLPVAPHKDCRNERSFAVSNATWQERFITSFASHAQLPKCLT